MIKFMIVVMWLSFMACANATTIRFVAENLPPFHFLNKDNQPDGALVDLVNALTKHTQIDATIELMPFARCYQLIRHNPEVMMISLLRTPAREQQFQWLGQTYKSEAYLIGLKRRKELVINQLDDAKNYVVGTIRGYYSETFLRQAGFEPQKNLALSVKYQRMWKMLFKNRIDFVLTNNSALETELNSIGLDVNAIKQYIAVADFPNQLFMVSHLQAPAATVKKLRQGLVELKQSGRYQQIIKAWGL